MLHNIIPDELTAIAENFKIGVDYALKVAIAEHKYEPGDSEWKHLIEKLSAIQKRNFCSLSMAGQGHVARLSANDIVTGLLADKKEIQNIMAQLKQHKKYRDYAEVILSKLDEAFDQLTNFKPGKDSNVHCY